MMKLLIAKNNSIALELELDTQKEYFIGRSPQCDIVLSEPEISRKHAKLYYKNNLWVCEVLSETGYLEANEAPIKNLSLAGSSKFKIGSFEITCIEEGSQTYALNADKTAVADEDKTNVGPAPIKFVLFREDAMGEPIEEITLHEGPITAGRSDECEILLHDSTASRKHFVLEKTTNGYLIKDLNSSHGTYINNSKIQNYELKTGDKIKVGTDLFQYQEIHSAFENLPALSATAQVTDNNVASSQLSNNAYANYDQPVVKIGGASKQKLKPAFIALTVIIVAYIINETTTQKKESTPQQRQVSSVTNQDSNLKLSDNQKKFLEETYNLALSLYTSGKYDLAALELSKIFQIVPNYKDAKNIEALCQQALELKKQKDESDRLVREQSELKEKVNGILADCEVLYNNKNYHKVESCVSQITEMDPENTKAKWLIESAQFRIDQIKNSKEAQAAALRRTQNAKMIFERAQKALKEKRYPAAVRDFTSVKQMSFTDTQNIKAKSEDSIKFAKEQMLKSSQIFVNEGKGLLEQKEYKAAILKLNKALELFKENKEAFSLKERAMSELRLEMKNLYSESVIEEDLGNIESAKKKWRTILDNNIPNDPYYQKAKNKINKYEK